MKFKLDHINLTVASLEESIDWYKKIFGMELVEEGHEDEKKWAIVARNDSMLCLHEIVAGEATPNYESRHKINHFGFRIPDRKKWEDIVKKYKLELFYGGVNHYPHSTSWYVKRSERAYDRSVLYKE